VQRLDAATDVMDLGSHVNAEAPPMALRRAREAEQVETKLRGAAASNVTGQSASAQVA